MDNTDQDEHYYYHDGQEVCQHETLHPDDRIIFFGDKGCPLCLKARKFNELKSNCRELYRDYVNMESPQISSKYREFTKGG